MKKKKQQLLKKLHLHKAKKLSILDRFLLGLILIGGIFGILAGAHALYFNFPQGDLAQYLPADKTVAFISAEDLNLPLGVQEGNTLASLGESMGQIFGLDVTPALESFGTGRVAYVLIENEFGKTEPVLIMQAKSKRGAKKYFESLLLEGESLAMSSDENPIYSYPQGQSFNFRFVKRFVAISTNPELLKGLSDMPSSMLSADETYMKSIANLPRGRWLLGYVNMEKLSFSENAAVNNVVEPLKHAVNHLAFTIRKDQKGLHFNTFLNMDKELLSLKAGEKEDKFAYKLASFVPSEDLALYAGGTNLKAEWQNTLETLTNLNPAYGIILEGLLRAQVDKAFGQNVDLRNDIYPLFEGEYALALGKGEGPGNMLLVLSHDDRDFMEKKMEKMAQGFKFIAASFAPRISSITLPDGSVSKELVPDDSKVNSGTEDFDGYEVICTEISSEGTGFCYTITDDLVVMSSSRNLIHDSLSGKENLSDHASFRKSLANLSKVSDEVTFINFDAFSKLLGTNPYILVMQPILSKLDSASYVKHYFDDGVSTEGYILVK